MGTRTLRVVLLFGLLAGCSSNGEVNGNLGRGSFSYKCVDQSDSACASATTGPTEFPGSIAEGAQFRLDYKANGDPTKSGNPTLRPVSNVYLAKEADTFTSLKSGFGAVIAKSTTTGEVLDYTLIKINPVGSLRLSGTDGNLPPPTVTLAKNAIQEYAVAALGVHGETLDGTLGYQWVSSDPAVVTLQQGNPAARMKVLASNTGTATLTVSLGSQTKTLTVTVTP
ncbi:MAG: hypothetical protein ABIP89_12940 [Polyangiaceae bacterium]